jgi:glycosyltransferase involved in cell wall biosynthesis
MFRPSQIHLVEPDLAEFGGHFYTQDSYVVQECNSRAIPVKVYGRQGTDLVIPGADMFRTFRFGVWIEPPQIESQTFAPFEIYSLVNRAFYLDLARIDTRDFGASHLVFFPGVTHNQLDAIAEWISILPEERRPQLVVTLRYLNSRMHFNEVRGFTHAIEFLYRHALSKLKERCPGVILVCDTETLSQEYQRMSGLTVQVMPVPQGQFLNLTSERGAEGNRRLSVLYIGNMSPLRGIDLVPKIAESTLLEFPEVEFTIQVHGDPSSAYAKDVMGLPDIFPGRVRILSGALPPDVYSQTMAAADIVLLPYVPSFYRWASSGVFAEAAAAGKVMVVSAGTNMAKWALDYDLGAVVATDFTAQSFSNALGQAVRDFRTLNGKAQASRSAFASVNSAKGFLDRLLAAIPEPAPVR